MSGDAALIRPAGFLPGGFDKVVGRVQLLGEFGGVGLSARVGVKTVRMAAFQVALPTPVSVGQWRAKRQVEKPVGICEFGAVGQGAGRLMRLGAVMEGLVWPLVRVLPWRAGGRWEDVPLQKFVQVRTGVLCQAVENSGHDRSSQHRSG